MSEPDPYARFRTPEHIAKRNQMWRDDPATKQLQHHMEVARRIKLRLYSELERLGAKSDLLGIIGSWGDSMDDEEVLEALMKRQDGRGATPALPDGKSDRR